MSEMIDLALIALFGLGMVLMAAVMILSIARNYEHGRRFRRTLAERLAGLRLERMARALGIDVERCLHDERVVQIEQSMQRCGTCTETEACDRELEKGVHSPRQIEFCPNRECLSKFVEQR